MDIVNICMNVGTALAALGTLPSIMAVIKNREVLRGYSPIGCFILFVAMINFAMAFTKMGYWISVLCGVPVAVFWFLAAVYSFKIRVRENGFSLLSLW